MNGRRAGKGSVMTLMWTKEASPRWDADKQRLFGPVGVPRAAAPSGGSQRYGTITPLRDAGTTARSAKNLRPAVPHLPTEVNRAARPLVD